MTSTILSLWYALLLAAAPPPEPADLSPRVEYAEADGWHYVVRKDDSYFVIQSGTPGRFKTGDRIKPLHERTGEQWVLVNNTPRRTSVRVYGYRLDYNGARILSAQYAMQQLARAD